MDVQLLEKLAISASNIRVQDFFEDFDKQNVKRIHPEQAIRALVSSGFELTPDEQARIKIAYTNEEGMFEYLALVADINSDRPPGYFEGKPEVDPLVTTSAARFSATGTFNAASSQPRKYLSDVDEDEIARIMRVIQYQVYVRGLDLRRSIAQYDFNKRGHITPERFKRELLSLISKLSAEDVDLLCEAYRSPDGQVRYIPFARDASPPSDDTQEVTSHRTHYVTASPNKTLTEQITAPTSEREEIEGLATLFRFIYERRIRVYDLFADFDRLRTGKILRGDFVRCLGGLQVPGLSARQLEVITDRYTDVSDPAGPLVLWRVFMEEAEGSNYERGLESDPLRDVGQTPTTAFAYSVAMAPNPRFMRPDLPDEDMERLEGLMSNLRAVVSRNRIGFVKESMRNYDVGNEGFISVARFQRVLASFDLLPKDEEDRSVLLTYYGGKENTPHEGMIEYRGFLRDLQLD